jgi:hypothetical protein
MPPPNAVALPVNTMSATSSGKPPARGAVCAGTTIGAAGLGATGCAGAGCPGTCTGAAARVGTGLGPGTRVGTVINVEVTTGRMGVAVAGRGGIVENRSAGCGNGGIVETGCCWATVVSAADCV